MTQNSSLKLVWGSFLAAVFQMQMIFWHLKDSLVCHLYKISLGVFSWMFGVKLLVQKELRLKQTANINHFGLKT